MCSHCTITILLSGRGSNLKSLIAHRENYSISHVLSDRADALGLEIAREAGIPTAAFPRGNYPSLALQKEAIYESVRATRPDYVVLAGYMQIVAPHFVEEFKGRILNIHPALLPALPGLHTHRRALEERHTTHGCTVHVVDCGVDTGPVIAQASVPVEANDTEETLAARVLAREHSIYPWVINQVGSGGIRIDPHRMQLHYTDETRESAKSLGFILPATTL